MIRVLVFAVLLVLLGGPGALPAQERLCAAAEGAAPGAPSRGLLRSATLGDSTALLHTWMVQRPSALPALCPVPSGATLLPLEARVEHRTGYADDRNNGAFWSGAGTNASLSAGARLRAGILTVVAAPTLVYSTNAEVPLHPLVQVGRSPYANPNHLGLDWPQRFGDGPFTRVDPGQSALRIDYRGAAAGLSSENLWWGPGRRSALLLGSTAPGFAHAFVGTSQPVRTRAGAFEAEAIWGNLHESAWFDTLSTNDRRRISGFAVTWAPPVLTGLQLGGARFFHFAIPEEGLPLSNWAFPFFEHFLKEELGSDSTLPTQKNQLAAFFLRWVLPGEGFEAYWELVRDDHSANLRDLLAQPRHVGGYLVGFQKVWDIPAGELRLAAEHMNVTNTNKGQEDAGRPDATLYNHHDVVQGHTHRGSMLGAPTGPGSTATYLSADWWNGGWGVGGYAERVVRDDDTFFRRWAQQFSFTGHDLEWTLGARGHVQRGALRLDATAAFSRRHNMLFIGLSDFSYETSQRENWLLETRLSWHPEVRLAF